MDLPLLFPAAFAATYNKPPPVSTPYNEIGRVDTSMLQGDAETADFRLFHRNLTAKTALKAILGCEVIWEETHAAETPRAVQAAVRWCNFMSGIRLKSV
jgi:hypothetical protein